MVAKVRLFERTNERYLLALPLLLLPPFLIVHFYGFGRNPSEAFILNFTCAIFLVSTVHLGFTLANVIALPEFKTWIHLKTGGRPYKVWLKWFFVYLALISAGLFCYRFIFYSSNFNYSDIFKSYFGLYYLASRAHTLMQTKGLISIYNHKITHHINDGKVSDKDKSIYRWEVFIIYMLILVCGSQAFLYVFMPRQRGLNSLEIASITIGALLVGALFLLSRKQTGAEKSTKQSYLLRLLYYPITPNIALATLATEIIHGIEYLFVTRELRGNSTLKSSRLWWALLIGFCSFVSLAWFLSSHQAFIKLLYQGNIKSIPTIFVIFSIINISNAFFHFYLDSVIFRFRDPINRENVGPLLSGIKAQAAS